MIFSTLLLAAFASPPLSYADGSDTARQQNTPLVTFVGRPVDHAPGYLVAREDRLPPFPPGSVVVSEWQGGQHRGYVVQPSETYQQTLARLRQWQPTVVQQPQFVPACANGQCRPQYVIPAYPFGSSCPGGNCPRTQVRWR